LVVVRGALRTRASIDCGPRISSKRRSVACGRGRRQAGELFDLDGALEYLRADRWRKIRGRSHSTRFNERRRLLVSARMQCLCVAAVADESKLRFVAMASVRPHAGRLRRLRCRLLELQAHLGAPSPG